MFDINRNKWAHLQRSNKEYLSYATRLLHLNVPLVLFAEKKFLNFIIMHRKGKERITKIVEMTAKDLEYNVMYDKIATVQKIMQNGRWKNDTFRNHPEISSPEYVVLMASKISVVVKAIKLNPFCSSYYYWIDFGCGRNDQIFPKSECWAPYNIMTDPKTKNKVVFMINDPMPSPDLFKMKSVDDLIANMKTVYVKGVFFGGHAEALIKYSELFHQTFVKLLRKNFTDDDQTITAACYLEQTEDFMFMYPSNIYDFFNMFKIFY